VETKTSLIEIMKYSDSVIVILFEGNKDPAVSCCKFHYNVILLGHCPLSEVCLLSRSWIYSACSRVDAIMLTHYLCFVSATYVNLKCGNMQTNLRFHGRGTHSVSALPSSV